MDIDQLDQALDVIRPSLSEDGFRLSVERSGVDGTVDVVLAATPDACMDCLVPDDMLLQIVETALKAEYPSVRHVRLRKVGFDDA